MNAIVDYIAWIAIGLGIVAVLFVLGTAYIFLDEGVKYIFRAFRKIKTVQSESARGSNVQPTAASLNATAETGRAFWSTLQSKLRLARLGTHFHIHNGRHKTAGAKP